MRRVTIPEGCLRRSEKVAVGLMMLTAGFVFTFLVAGVIYLVGR